MRSLRWFDVPERSRRWALPLAATLLALFDAAPARAAVTTISLQPQILRVAADGKTAFGCPERNSQTNSCIVDGTFQGIGFHDCIADTQLVFKLNIPGLPDPNVNLQVWAGTGDCTQAGATNNASTGICWQVAPTPPLSNPLTINVRVADIVSNLGIAPPPQTFQPASATVACNRAASNSATTTVVSDSGQSSTTVGETTVKIFFMIFGNNQTGTAPITSTSATVKVKLVGPAAPTNVTAGGGDGIIIVTWSPPPSDLTIQGFDLFAAPSGSITTAEGGTQTVCNDASTTGNELVDDAGVPILDDAGNPIFVDDAGIPVPQDAGCVIEPLSPTVNSCSGATGTIDVSGITCTLNNPDGGTSTSPSPSDAGGDAGVAAAVCDQVNGPTNAKGTITGLTNGVTYDVAVAAFDQFGNNGAPSSAVCATPKPINDFWTTYNKDGGNAFCALSLVGNRRGGVAAGLMSIVGMLWLRRRRRSARS